MLTRRGAFPWYMVWLISVIGLGLSAWLVMAHYTGNNALCDLGDGCDFVIVSRFATLFDVPVSLLAAAGFALMLLASIAVIVPDSTPRWLRFTFILVTLPVSAVGVGASLYLAAMQVFVLESLCILCLASSALMVAAFAFALVAFWLHRRSRVWRDDVVIALRKIGVSSENAGREVVASQEMRDKLDRFFDRVETEKSFKTPVGTAKIDLDINDWAYGVEVKLAKSLNMSESHRLVGQAQMYKNMKYGGNLIVAVIGEKEDFRNSRMSGIFSVLDEHDIDYTVVRIDGR